MRVVMVCDFGAPNGGAAKVAIVSAQAMARGGIPVTFVCAVPPISPQLTDPGITVRCLELPDVWSRAKTAGAAVQGVWNGAARRALAAVLADLPPASTIVHFHQWTKALSPSVLAVPDDLGCASVVTLHDYFCACPNGAYYNFQAEQPCRFRPMSAACVMSNCDRRSRSHKAVRLARQVATRQALRRRRGALAFVHVSEFARALITPYLAPAARHFVVANPIDVEREPPAPVASNSEFIYVGRFTEEKGVRMLAEATHSTGIPIAFVGGGDLEDGIRARNPAARLVPWASSRGVADHLRRARALVFASRWPEVGGLVVSEAMACGVPVVVSRGTGPADLVEPGVNGLLFDPDNPAELIQCLRQLQDDDVASRMGMAAFERYWRDPYTVDRHGEALHTVYRSVLAL